MKSVLIEHNEWFWNAEDLFIIHGHYLLVLPGHAWTTQNIWFQHHWEDLTIRHHFDGLMQERRFPWTNPSICPNSEIWSVWKMTPIIFSYSSCCQQQGLPFLLHQNSLIFAHVSDFGKKIFWCELAPMKLAFCVSVISMWVSPNGIIVFHNDVSDCEFRDMTQWRPLAWQLISRDRYHHVSHTEIYACQISGSWGGNETPFCCSHSDSSLGNLTIALFRIVLLRKSNACDCYGRCSCFCLINYDRLLI